MSTLTSKPFIHTGLNKNFVRKNQAYINPVMPVDFSKERVSYNTGGSDYKWVAERFRIGQSLGTRVESTGDDVMRGRCDFGSASGELVNFETTIYPRTGKYPTICTRETGMDATDALGQYMSVGRLSTAADVQSIKVAMSSGNISTGNFRLYGLAIS